VSITIYEISYSQEKGKPTDSKGTGRVGKNIFNGFFLRFKRGETL